MSAMSQFVRQLFGRATRPVRRATPDARTRLGCEGLEAREVPAAFELPPIHRGPLIEIPTNPSSVPAAVENGDLVIRGTESTDSIAVVDFLSFVEVTVNGQTAEFSRPSGRVVVYGNGGDDTINLNRTSLTAWVDAGAGDDRVYGSSGRDTIYGKDGKDYIQGDPITRGVGVADYIDGGRDDDDIAGWNGDDTLIGGEGNDQLYGNDGKDTLNGGEGADKLYGGAGDDVLYGDNAGNLAVGVLDDELYGGSGRDLLRGEGGNDTLSGDGDDDDLDGGTGLDGADGGDGFDVAALASAGDTANETVEKLSIQGVPAGFLQTDDWSCGPNAGARLLRYYGINATYSKVRAAAIYNGDLVSRFKIATTPGALRDAVAKWKPDIQLRSRTDVSQGIEPVLEQLAAGKPVIALLNVGGYKSKTVLGVSTGTVPTQLHWILVTGFDRQSQTVTYIDGYVKGGSQVKTLSFAEFWDRWNFRASGATGDFLTGTLGVKQRTMLY